MTYNVFSGTLNPTHFTSLVQGVEVQALLDDVRKLKIIAKGHERRIKYLEDRLAAYEDVAACIDDHIDEQME